MLFEVIEWTFLVINVLFRCVRCVSSCELRPRALVSPRGCASCVVVRESRRPPMRARSLLATTDRAATTRHEVVRLVCASPFSRSRPGRETTRRHHREHAASLRDDESAGRGEGGGVFLLARPPLDLDNTSLGESMTPYGTLRHPTTRVSESRLPPRASGASLRDEDHLRDSFSITLFDEVLALGRAGGLPLAQLRDRPGVAARALPGVSSQSA